jgi:hypothetical protein
MVSRMYRADQHLMKVGMNPPGRIQEENAWRQMVRYEIRISQFVLHRFFSFAIVISNWYLDILSPRTLVAYFSAVLTPTTDNINHFVFATLQVRKEQHLQEEQSKQSKHIATQNSRGRKWMGGSVSGAYMQSMEPKPAPFYDDERVWKRELLHRDQKNRLEMPLERMHTTDLISLQRRTNEVGKKICLNQLALHF